MRCTVRACAFLVLCVVSCSVGAASPAAPAVPASRPDEGDSKMLARRLLQAPARQQSAPCAHSQAVQQSSTTSGARPKQSLPAVKGAAAVAAPNRQLLQAPTRPRRPAPALTPTQRQGFSTGRRPGVVNPVQQGTATRQRTRTTAG